MKKFFLVTLLAALFFVGIGGMINETSAKFKSDERALALLAKARQAIGGEQNLASVNSLIVKGKMTKVMRMGDTERAEAGEMEIAMQYPDKLFKTIKLGDGFEKLGDDKAINRETRTIVMANDGEAIVTGNGEGDVKNFVFTRKPGEAAPVIGEGQVVVGEDKKVMIFRSEDGKTAAAPLGDKNVVIRELKGGQAAPRSNELLRVSLSLFLTAPQSMDVAYSFAGEGSVDGTACNMIDAQFGGESFRLYLNKTSNLPVMISYLDNKAPMTIHIKRDESAPAAGGEKQVRVFTHKPEGAGAGDAKTEVQIKFSDYRNVNGVLLPHTWTQSADGKLDETFNVDSYDINSPNAAEKFQNMGPVKVFMRKAKEQ